MNNKSLFHIASSLVLLAILFTSTGIVAQIPKKFIKFTEKQNKIKSGYIHLQRVDFSDGDSLIREQKAFYISTKNEINFLIDYHWKKYPGSLIISCKSARTIVNFTSDSLRNILGYWDIDEVFDANDLDVFLYPTANGFSLQGWNDHIFQRVTPKINKKNIRYKILYPDQEHDLTTNICREYEFERKTFNWVQDELLLTYDKSEQMGYRIDIKEQCLYDYIHSDILDTIIFQFEELKKGYDRQTRMEQSKKDSVLRAHLIDSIVQSITKNGYQWTNNVPREPDEQKDTLFFMPEWKFPLLSDDTIYSNNINSQFLLIDMWYTSCHPCRMAMRELATIDTLYNESLLKIVSINITDKDIAKISKVIKNLNLKCDVALAYNGRFDMDMSEQMGDCQGYPQLYLIDMNTKQVIWHSCGWYAGFTKDIEEIIKKKK